MEELLARVPELPLLVLAFVAVVLWRAARRAAVVLLLGTLLLFVGGVAAHQWGPALCYPQQPATAILYR